MLLESAARNNILPVISTCNVRCKFCSHGQNPASVESVKLPPISLELLEQALSLIDPEKPVVIGESATRLIEGEPFTHPRFRDILVSIREKLPNSQIRLTTNGNMLDVDTVDFLASLGNVLVNLSLNSADVSVRKYLMADAWAERAVAAPALLRERGIVYHGSVVAMPHLVGWGDLAGTLGFLDRNGAATIRVFLPGHTRFSPPELRVPAELRKQLGAFVVSIKSRIKTPVILEPPAIDSLNAEVSGVMAGSPAAGAGIMAGDTISGVNGRPVSCRVDAFRRVLEGADPDLDILRNGDSRTVRMLKKSGQPSGLVFDFDVDPDAIREIIMAVNRKRSRRPLLLTSEFGYPAMKMGLERFGGEGIRAEAVKNRFFGGSIGCAGLLTVEDMLRVVKRHAAGTDLVLVPGVAFDTRGRDITGRSYLDLVVGNGYEIVVL